MHVKRSVALEALLPYAELLEGLDRETLSRIARSAASIRLAKHDMLFEAGSRCDGFHLVVHGQIKLFTNHGHERIVEIVDEGQTFGETLMFSDQPNVVSARALADTWVVFVPKDAILLELDANPPLRMRLLAKMSAHLHELMANRQCETQQSGTQRLIGYLLRQIPDPANAGRDVVVELPTTKGNISSLLNLTKEHFSRILRTLSQRGLIAVAGCRILIPDVALLVGYRESEALS